jgi:hypothetical protein
MKVFISWSGDLSDRVAIALRNWLPSVLQSIEPYVSSEDIDKGARWSADVGKELDATHFGILCVTRENIGSPWLNFEAGALSKSIEISRVSPFLLNVRPAELVGPLSQFQATLPRLDDVTRLVKSMNAFSERPIDESRLIDAIRMWWPQLERALKDAEEGREHGQQEPERGVQEMIEELLEITRGLQRQLVYNEMELQPQIVAADIYPSRSASTRGERRLAKEIDLVLAPLSGENDWRYTINDREISVGFEITPQPLVLQHIKRIADRYGREVVFGSIRDLETGTPQAERRGDE